MDAQILLSLWGPTLAAVGNLLTIVLVSLSPFFSSIILGVHSSIFILSIRANAKGPDL